MAKKVYVELHGYRPPPTEMQRTLAAEMGTNAQNNNIHGIIFMHGKLKVANRLREHESGGDQKTVIEKVKLRPMPMTAASKLTIPAKGSGKFNSKKHCTECVPS